MPYVEFFRRFISAQNVFKSGFEIFRAAIEIYSCLCNTNCFGSFSALMNTVDFFLRIKEPILLK